MMALVEYLADDVLEDFYAGRDPFTDQVVDEELMFIDLESMEVY